MSSRSLNLVQLIGNLTRDPELRYTPNGTAVCTIGIATNRTWTTQDGGEKQEDTQYHRIVTWSKLAEICGKLLKKGSKVYVQGRLQTRKWQTKDGAERETTEIVADNVILLSSTGGREDMGGGNEGSYSYPEEKAEAPANQSVNEVSTSVDVTDDIPF
jgi:single-strand DNA-binding protein